MKLFKLFLGALLILNLSAVLTMAQDASSEAITQKAIATVNIQDSKILSQDKNVFNIYFKLTNREGVQTGIKYGVSLLSESKGKKTVVDEKVYDESFALLDNDSVVKNIQYIAPQQLEGNYSIVISISNSSGFPFAFSPGLKTSLKSTLKGVYLIPDSCQTALGYVSSISKTSNQAFVFPKQNINIECSAINTSSSQVVVTPVTQTYYRSIYGAPAIEEQQSSAITFGSKETKKININVVAPEKPQAYTSKISLMMGDQLSNTLSLGYVVRGSSATIQNISLDKDIYKKDDIARISVVWSGSADVGIEQAPGGWSLVVSTKMKDSSGLSCAKIADQTITLDSFNGLTEIPVSISFKCDTPSVSVSISDQNGQELAQRNYSSKGGDVPMGKVFNKKFSTLVAILILLILAFAIYKKFKNKKTSSNMNVPPVAIFVLALGLATLLPANKAHADTFLIGQYHNAFATVNLVNGTNYPVGTISIPIHGQITSTSNPGINNDVSLSVYTEGTNPPSSPSSSVEVIALQNLQHGATFTNNISVPTLSSIGSYLAKFTATIDEVPYWNPDHVFFTGWYRNGKVNYTGPANHSDLITVRVQLHGVSNPSVTSTGIHTPDTIFYIRPGDTRSYLSPSGGGEACGSGDFNGCEIENSNGFNYGVVTSISSSTNAQLDNYIPLPYHICVYSSDPYPDGNYFAEPSNQPCASRHPGSVQYQ